MAKVRVLNVNEVEGLFNMKMALEAVESAYRAKAKGHANLWPMIFHEFEAGKSDLDIKSGDFQEAGIYGLKVVSWYGENPAKALPSLLSTSLIFDIQTGQPKALLNAASITHYRTGAAAAIGAKYLARKDAKQLLMCGCGHVAANLVVAAIMTLPQLEKITIVDTLDAGKTASLLEKFQKEVYHILKESSVETSLSIQAASNLQIAVEESDIIFTATPSYKPFIKAEWVKPGTHFSCIGADLSGKEEIAKEIFKQARVFGDDRQQCFSVGECEIPFKEGIISDLDAEIGQVMLGLKDGRLSDQDITIFDSTGIALQDLASAGLILEKAEKSAIGQLIEF